MATNAFLRLCDNAVMTVNALSPNPLLSKREQPEKYQLDKAIDFVMLRLQYRKVRGYSKPYVRQLLQEEYPHLKEKEAR